VKINQYSVYLKSWPLMVALGVALALVGTINILWWQLNQKEEEEVQWVSHKFDIEAALDQLMLRANDIEVGQRVYAITREREFLGPYMTATNDLPRILDKLTELTKDEPRERTKLAQLKIQINRHLQLNRDHLESLLTGDPQAPDLAFRATIQDSLTKINSLQRNLGGLANERLNEQRSDFMATVQSVILLNMIAGIIAVGMIFTAVAALWRENKRRRAVEAALRLSHKELENRVTQRTAALREQQARLQLAQSAAHLGIFDWNFRTGYMYRTPELAAMYGVPVGFLRQPPGEWMKLVHPDDRPVLSNWLREARETGRPTEGEWRVVWPDGSVHWLFGRWQAFLDEHGEALTMIGVNLDVTDRKRLEQELLEASDNEMRRIGHDLHDGVGQQLTALTFFHATLQAEVERQMPHLADQFKRMGSSLHEIVRQVRMLSHGLAPVPIRETGLADALQQLAADTTASTGLECEFMPDSAVQLEDAQQATQVFRIAQEAVNNALKHSGGDRIVIAFAAEAAGWQLTVSDNGRGFRETDRREGSGLGLRAMRHRASLMGALLKIESKPGAGTRIICAAQR